MSEYIVIGAGMAGLTSARTLQKAGHSVVVLEARNRIGGRTFTDNVGSARIDLGGSWMHGHIDSPITRLNEEFGLAWRVDDSWENGSHAFAEGVGWLDPELADLAVGAQWKWDPGAAAAHLGRDGAHAEAIEWHLAQLDLPEAALPLADFRMRWIDSALYTAGRPEEISLQGSAQYREYDGGNAIIIGGYGLLVDKLAEGLDIRLNHIVERVDHQPDGVVTTNHGVFEADRIIVTVPLGVLKSGNITFSPPLPGQDSIDRLIMGKVDKIVLVFDERWWPTDHKRFMYVSESHRTPQWIDLTQTAGQPTLLAFYNEDTTLGWNEMSSEERCKDALGIIREMFGASPDPVASRATNWATDPFSLGSYSFIPIGATPGDMDALTQPQSDRLVLAGEHTVAEHFGTVHAAIESGYRAAAL